MKKKSHISLAHISDLHFEDTSSWMSHFNALKKSLLKQQPDVIVNTGDLLNTPAPDEYLKLSRILQKLCEEIEEEAGRAVNLVSVPGNHDYFSFGFLPFKKDDFASSMNLLQYPQKVGLSGVVKEVYERTRIAIFPLDSNDIEPSRDLFGFAQGKIIDVDQAFGKYRDCFPGIEKSLLKIALLHHHPLPMPLAGDERKEPFLLLRKAHDFLLASLSNKIDLILHGHMHRAGACEYRSFVPDASTKPIRIFGCSSSGKPDEPERGYIIHEIEESGYVHSHLFNNNAASQDYNSRKDYLKSKPVEIIPYRDVRKIKNKNHALYDSPSPILRARQKSKIIRILPDGDALADIFIDGITLTSTADISSVIIKEQATADVGRIPYFATYLGTDVPKMGNMSMLSGKQLVKQHNILPEVVDLELRQDNLDTRLEYYSQIRYPMLGGFCTSVQEHQWLYQGKNLTQNNEFCYAFTSCPTDQLEINVKFEDQDFPDSKSFVLVAAKKTATNYCDDGYIFLKQNYEKCYYETEFLKQKAALSVRPSTNEVNARIRYPQPDLVYILQWCLLSKTIKNEANNRYCNEIRMRIASEAQVASALWSTLSNGLTSVFEGRDFQLVLLAIVPDEESGVACFKGIAGPDRYINKKFFVTRGVAGRAFKSGAIKAYSGNASPEFQYIEKIDEDFYPAAAISIPIILDGQEVHFQVDNQENYSPEHQVACVFSVVFSKPQVDLDLSPFLSIENDIQICFQSLF